MSASIHDIAKSSFPATIPVFKEAPEALVIRGELRKKYHTNRDIETWATWFLLRACTTSSMIFDWRLNRKLHEWLQLSPGGLYIRLKRMVEMGLIEIDSVPGFHSHIIIGSYKNAAEILGVKNEKTPIPYEPKPGSSKLFKYLLIREDIKNNQFRQTDGLFKKLDKNLSDKKLLQYLMMQKLGAQKEKLEHKEYFRLQLQRLEEQAFKEKSEITDLITRYRADNNRCVKTIADHHNLKTPQSVSYRKKCMVERGIVEIEKPLIISRERVRIHINGKDAYLWMPVQKQTAWRPPDNIKMINETNKELQRVAA